MVKPAIRNSERRHKDSDRSFETGIRAFSNNSVDEDDENAGIVGYVKMEPPIISNAFSSSSARNLLSERNASSRFSTYSRVKDRMRQKNSMHGLSHGTSEDLGNVMEVRPVGATKKSSQCPLKNAQLIKPMIRSRQ